MKLILTILSAMIFSTAITVHAQEETKTPPDQAPAATAAPATQAGAKIAPAKPAAPRSIDTIRGNAGKDVAFVEAKGDCAGGLKPIGITNKSKNWAIKAAVDVLVTFGGRVSKKTIIVDNLVAGEVRFLGCTGCIDNQTGKTCTTYKITIAAYKPQ